MAYWNFIYCSRSTLLRFFLTYLFPNFSQTHFVERVMFFVLGKTNTPFPPCFFLCTNWSGRLEGDFNDLWRPWMKSSSDSATTKRGYGKLFLKSFLSEKKKILSFLSYRDGGAHPPALPERNQARRSKGACNEEIERAAAPRLARDAGCSCILHSNSNTCRQREMPKWDPKLWGMPSL